MCHLEQTYAKLTRFVQRGKVVRTVFEESAAQPLEHSAALSDSLSSMEHICYLVENEQLFEGCVKMKHLACIC